MNKDLADVLGNFVSRVTKFAAARFGDVVPAGGAYGRGGGGADRRTRARGCATTRRTWTRSSCARRRRSCARIWVAGNEYLQAAAPWTAIKTDPDRAAAVTRFACNLIRLYAVLSRPFIPDASDAMLARLRLDARRLAGRRGDGAEALPAGHRSTCPTCCSPRSTTRAGPNSRRASRVGG